MIPSKSIRSLLFAFTLYGAAGSAPLASRGAEKGVTTPQVLLGGARFTALQSSQPTARLKALLDRPKADLTPAVTRSHDGDFAIERGRFRSDQKEWVPFLLVKLTDPSKRLPAVLVLHGTGGNKERMLDTLRELARRGFLAIAIDGRYFGERVAGGANGTKEYQAAILRAWKEPDAKKQEHPFFFDTVYDVWRTLDYLETRDDVDASRIGAIGFSKGGIETWLAAAADPRIRVVVPAIAVQSFRWSLEHDQWQGRAKTIQDVHDAVAAELGEKQVNQRVCRALWSKLLPGILDELDGPGLIPLIAPRPMLILSGELDPNCPLEGARLAFHAAESAYRRAGASDHLTIDVARGVAHAVTPEQRTRAYEWFERWLKP